jgi:hypothetical protein
VTEERIDLAGLTILTLDDQREELAGSYTAAELAEVFVSDWIPYFECEKCGRRAYCKYTKADPYRAGRLAQIQCGVLVTMISHYVGGVFPLLRTLSRQELQGFLDGSYYLVKFVYETELHIGHMIDEDFIEWLGNEEYRASFFGATARLRKHLDRLAAALRSVEPFHTKSAIILAEGAAEKAFLQKLRESRLLWFIDLEVESYYGKGNRGPKKLRLLAQRLRGQGYDVFIQGDCDGKVRDIFQQLVQKGLVDADKTFAFEVDFETSFPPDILQAALSDMGLLAGVPFKDFNDKALKMAPGQSILDVLRTEFGIKPDKVELAEALGAVLNESADWGPHSPFWSSEIGRFLDRIRRLP